MEDYDVIDLRKAFSKLESSVQQLKNEPEITLFCYSTEDDESPDFISVFWKEGYLYKGDDFNALADNMKGQKTRCFKISNDVREILSQYFVGLEMEEVFC